MSACIDMIANRIDPRRGPKIALRQLTITHPRLEYYWPAYADLRLAYPATRGELPKIGDVSYVIYVMYAAYLRIVGQIRLI